MEMKNLAFLIAIIFSVVLVSRPAMAHHGEANYDTEKFISVKGTVTEFQFINPHVLISVEVKNERGEIEKWTGEARSPAMLSRYGNWDKGTIKIGDVITLTGHRTKNGTNFMRLEKIILPDGKELPNL
jgi:DNA/RNA endonuclease YhcR with UshA esterase domain